MLVGRDAEIAQVADLLAKAAGGQGGALVLRGLPGVGKSTLLGHAVGQAIEAEPPVRVLRTCGIESEAPLAFAALQGAVGLEAPDLLGRRRPAPLSPGRMRLCGGQGAPAQLGERERLGEIVVGAEAETRDPLVHRVGGGEHEDSGQRVRLHDGGAHAVAGHHRDVAVEHDVVVVDRQALQGGVTVVGDVDGDGVGVGWLGAVLGYMALDIVTVVSQDVTTVRGAYIAMDLIVRYAIVPLALASVVVGIVNAGWRSCLAPVIGLRGGMQGTGAPIGSRRHPHRPRMRPV
jgi:hypothetical protein